MFDQYITFVSQHWALASIFTVVLVLFLINEAVTRASGIPKLGTQEATVLINRDKAKVIDLRSPEDFKRGHITGALNVPVKSLTNTPHPLAKYKELPLILACATGQQAPSVGATLRKEGFTQVSCLAGGINHWRNENLPLIRGTR